MKKWKLTCHNRFRALQAHKDMLDEADVGAGLQVANAFAQDGNEHAPDLRLQRTRKYNILLVILFIKDNIREMRNQSR